MAGKTDFTADEWGQLQRGVMGTTLLVSISDPGLFDTFREAGAAGRYLAQARQANSSELVRELAQDPVMGFGMGMNQQQLETETLDALRSALAAIRAKAPDEADAYRQFVLDVAQAVADATDGVGGGETASIEKLRTAMGDAA